jgi:hypothetical protein
MKSEPSVLRDFTVDRRVWLLSGVSIGIGVCATALALLLLRCIALSTNLFYYHRFSFAPVSPAGSPLGYWMVIVPVVGGLLVGLMARFGSDKIRGHGIPEAIEAILLHRVRVDQSRCLETHISRDCDRIRRPLWRRRADHRLGGPDPPAHRPALRREVTGRPGDNRCGSPALPLRIDRGMAPRSPGGFHRPRAGSKGRLVRRLHSEN